MQKSPKTPRMQNPYCVNYDRLVSMTRFAATVRAGGACAAITCHGQREDHRHARTTWVHLGAYLPHHPGHVGRKPLRRKSHLCCEEAIRQGVPAPP